MSLGANLPPEGRERRWLEIWVALVEQGVPHAVASDAMQAIRRGVPVAEVTRRVEAAIPPQ